MNINRLISTGTKTLCRFKVLVLLFMLTEPVFAQNDTIVPLDVDPEEFLTDLDLRASRDPRFNVWNDKFKGHWVGFDIGFNTFVNEDYAGYDSDFLNNDVFRSNSAYVNLLQKNIGLQRNRNTIGLVTGLGLHLQSYRLDNNTSIKLTGDGKVEPEFLYFDQNQKSKFSVFSLMVPLLAEFQVPLNHYNNRIYISGGMYGGVRLSSHTKIKYRADGKKEKLKTPGHYSLQDIKYGVMIRAGYRWFNVFATYDLVPFFKDTKGPELTAVTFGVTLISF